MKLRPTQMIGLAAIVVFGGILVWTLVKPKRDPMILPNGLDLRTLPSPSSLIAPDIPLIAPAAPAGLAAPGSLLVGSQDAKDDLYCSGVVFAVRSESGDPLSPEAQHRRDLVIALAESGVKKLAAEGAAALAATGPIADAHSSLARSDHEAGMLRIPAADCLARAEALSAPPAPPPLPAPVPLTPAVPPPAATAPTEATRGTP